MYKIIVFENKYKDGVEDVCIAASTRARSKEDDWGKVILRLFCRYYIEQEPNHCFIAINENDEVIGYVICTSDYDSWKIKFREKYLNTCKEKETEEFGELSISGIEKYAKEYPAHLHINVHPNYQRMGIGNKLIEALVYKLKEEKVKGLMLDVSSNNEKGINFYRKCDFKEIDQREYDTIFAVKL